MAGCADREADLLHELHHAHQRVADLTAEIDILRWRLSRAERSAGMAAASAAEAGRGVAADAHGGGGCGAAAAGAAMPAPGTLNPPPPSPPHDIAAASHRAGRCNAAGSGIARGGGDAAAHVRAAAAAVDVAACVVASWLEAPLTPVNSARLVLHGKSRSNVVMPHDASSLAQRAAHGQPARLMQSCRPGSGGSDRGVRSAAAAVLLDAHNASASQSMSKAGVGSANGRVKNLGLPTSAATQAARTAEVPNAAVATDDFGCDALCDGGSVTGQAAACRAEAAAHAEETGAFDEEIMRLRLANRRLLAALSAERSRLSDAESQLLTRQAEHRDDLLALGRVREDAAVAARALRDQAEWVRSLDGMRIADLQTIQRLEARLEWVTELFQPTAKAN